MNRSTTPHWNDTPLASTAPENLASPGQPARSTSRDAPAVPTWSGPAPQPAWARVARIAYAALTWIFVLCVVIQVFLAGLDVFAGPENWSLHKNFIHTFELVPLLMLLAAFAGRMSRGFYGHAAGLFGLIMVQYVTANFRNVLEAQAIAALHPIIALLIFWVALQTAQRATRLVRLSR